MSATKMSYDIQLRGIELLESCLIHTHHLVPEMFNFVIKLEHKYKAENNLVIVELSIEISNEPGDIKFGSLRSCCIFEISKLIDFIDRKTKNLNLPKDLLTKINSISISTARGIMYSQFRGTFLDKAYLPIFDPKSFTIEASDRVT